MKRKNDTVTAPEMTLSRADAILFGKLRGQQEDLLENKDNSFAYAFLLLAERLNGQGRGN